MFAKLSNDTLSDNYYEKKEIYSTDRDLDGNENFGGQNNVVKIAILNY